MHYERLSEGYVAGATCYLRRRYSLLQMDEPQTAVAVGVVNLPKPDALLNRRDVNKVATVFFECAPRFLMGNFGCNPQFFKDLAEKYCFLGVQPFVQPWIYKHRLHFFPNYIIPVGLGGQCHYPDTAIVPSIDDYVAHLDETTRSCVQSSLLNWFNLPRWEACEVETFEALPEHFANLGNCLSLIHI